MHFLSTSSLSSVAWSPSNLHQEMNPKKSEERVIYLWLLPCWSKHCWQQVDSIRSNLLQQDTQQAGCDFFLQISTWLGFHLHLIPTFYYYLPKVLPLLYVGLVVSLQQTLCAYDCYEDSMCQVAHDHVWYLSYTHFSSILWTHEHGRVSRDFRYFSLALSCNVVCPTCYVISM